MWYQHSLLLTSLNNSHSFRIRDINTAYFEQEWKMVTVSEHAISIKLVLNKYLFGQTLVPGVDMSTRRKFFMTFVVIVWFSTSNFQIRMRLLRALVTSVFLYGCDTWTLNAEIGKRINSFEINCMRRFLQVHYTSHTSNNKIRELLIS